MIFLLMNETSHITGALEKFTIRQVDAQYINQNQEKVFSSWVKVWQESGWGEEEVFTLDGSLEYISRLSNEGMVYTVEDNDQIIAFAMATIGHFPESKSEQEGKVYDEAQRTLKNPAFLHELAIIPAYRGRGLGSELLDMLEHKVKNIGADGMFTWTRKDSPSLRLYQRYNYKIISEATVPKNNKVGKENRSYLLKKL